jgi:hypothetical protein
MRVVVSGSRTITEFALVEKAIRESGFEISVLLSGHAKGVDRLAERWAKENGIPIETFPALWEVHGIIAGHLRNGEMVDKSEGLIAVWDGLSAGTRDIIVRAKKKDRRVFVFRTGDA